MRSLIRAHMRPLGHRRLETSPELRIRYREPETVKMEVWRFVVHASPVWSTNYGMAGVNVTLGALHHDSSVHPTRWYDTTMDELLPRLRAVLPHLPPEAPVEWCAEYLWAQLQVQPW